MAYDKAVDSGVLNAGLTSIADAIRTKGGTSAAMAFPAGFVAAIEAITAGGGELQYATGTMTPSLSNTLTITGLAFTPKIVAYYVTTYNSSNACFGFCSANKGYAFFRNAAYTTTFTPTANGCTIKNTISSYICGGAGITWCAWG